MDVVVVFGDAKVAFCQQHEAVAWDVVFCDCLADDFFAAAVGVNVGLCLFCVSLVWGRVKETGEANGIPGVDAAVVGVFE
jgi:hypothetical protein